MEIVLLLDYSKKVMLQDKDSDQCRTFQRIPGEAELADDVSRDVSLDALAHLGLTLCSLQTLVKCLWIKLLEKRKSVLFSLS